MNKKDFPNMGISQVGLYMKTLANYYLPNFILALVAKECNSDLSEKGRTDKKLQSMNKKALELLYQIFVKCEEDEKGKYDQYRFFSYVSSMYHKCEILINEIIPGTSGKNHLVPMAIKNNGMYIAVAFNNGNRKSVTKEEIKKFYRIVDDLKQGVHGTQLTDSIYCSSTGFMGNAIVELENLNNKRSKNPETKINFKIANFENQIYSLMKC